jgi:hypothetical protein
MDRVMAPSGLALVPAYLPVRHPVRQAADLGLEREGYCGRTRWFVHAARLAPGTSAPLDVKPRNGHHRARCKCPSVLTASTRRFPSSSNGSEGTSLQF